MILITGGGGYLGGRLGKSLSTSFDKKVVVTKRDNSRHSNKSLSRCETRVMDVMNIDQVNNCLEGITEVIHLVSYNVYKFMENPQIAKETSVEGTKNLIKACKNRKIKRFIYFSSAHVYRTPLIGSINESTKPCPTHPYARAHLEAENIILEECFNSDITPTILRLSNAVGPPMNKEADCWMLVVNDIARQIATNGRMEFRSQRNIQRDYIGINQICRIVAEIISSSKKISGIYNLGGGRSLTLEDLAKLISQRAMKTLGVSIESTFPEDSVMSHFPYPDKGNTELIISTEKIEKEIMNIEIDLEKEIDDLLISTQKWFKKAM